MHHVVRISGAWVSCANVQGYRLTSPDTYTVLLEKLVEANCRPSHGTQVHMESGDNRFSSRWRRETSSVYTLDSRLRQLLGVSGCRDLPDNLGEVFPMELVTRTPHVKKPPRKKSVGHDEWQRPILLEPNKKKRVRYCQRCQDFLRISREYLTSHYLRKKSRFICLSLKACGTAGQSGYFRQDGATCHVTRESIVMIQSFFDDRATYTLRPSIITRLNTTWFLIVGIHSGRSVPQKKKNTDNLLLKV